jgi:hypothetical protein
MTDFAGLIRTLVDARVDFILVGGVAATVHGRLASHATSTLSMPAPRRI